MSSVLRKLQLSTRHELTRWATDREKGPAFVLKEAFGLERGAMPGDLVEEHRDAALLASLAGKALVELRGDPGDAPDIGAAGDRLAHHLLVDELKRLYPADDVRSEEGLEHVAGDGRLWIVDPLDGTREFREVPRTDWAVHVAMAVGGQAVVGAVALPALEMVLSTGEPPTLPPYRRDDPPRSSSRAAGRPTWPTTWPRPSTPFWSPWVRPGPRSRRSSWATPRSTYTREASTSGTRVRPFAVALASGLHASRLDGSPLRYGAPDAWLPDLVVCRRELADDVLAVTAARSTVLTPSTVARSAA